MHSRTIPFVRAALTALLLVSFSVISAAQERLAMPNLSRNPEWFPRFYKPYLMQKVPQSELSNSLELLRMIEDGRLRVSLTNLKSAVSENNLDIMATRNSANYAWTDLLRVKGGGAPRGGAGMQIPSGLFSGAIGAGLGGGGGVGGFGSAGGITGGARQVFGFPRGTYDPSLAIGFSIDRTNSPLNSIVVAGLPEVETRSVALQARYSQAFSTGTSLSVSLNNMRQSSTQRFLRYNPDVVSQLSINFTQQLLSGFGRSVGRRFIEVAENEEDIMKENVRLQVNTTQAQAQGIYWELVAARENVKVAEQSLAVARRLLEENRQREEIGTLSGLDVITSESEVAMRERDLVASRTALQLREVELKNVMSRDLAGLLDSVQIEAVDPLPEPRESDIPRLADALSVAQKNRPELRQGQINLNIQDIAIRYAKDALRPSLLLFANFNSSGLYGNRIFTDSSGATVVLPGGLSQALRQVRNWSYPDYAVGISFSINIRNRAAEADVYRARLEKRQSETTLQRTRTRIELEVRKALIGLVQSKAQVEAAHKAVELSTELLAAEENKLLAGASIPYQVITRQRDLRSAQLAEVRARVDYAKALVELGRATGSLD
ncbi:MAG: TolC family protein [Acidobacteria bacterium]|nr:TolC family protein [Acidobacteriota bacterium]